MPVSISGSGPNSGLYLPPVGQCRLVKDSTNIRLNPFNGNYLTIAGVHQQIPAAGVALGPSGLANNTRAYIYAFMNGSAMTLEGSTTGYVADASFGHPIKLGDGSRTLVGMVYPKAGAFVDQLNARLVSSYWNRKNIRVWAAAGVDASWTNGTPTDLHSGYHLEFLQWAGDTQLFGVSGNVTNNTASAFVGTQISIDASGSIGDPGVHIISANLRHSCVGMYPIDTASEGFHFATFLGYVSSGTGTWYNGMSTMGIVQG